MKKCIKCEITKPLETGFYPIKHSNGKTYYTSKCRSCKAKDCLDYVLEYKRTHKDKSRAWDKKQKDKIYADPVKHEHSKRLKRESNYRCFIHVLWKRAKERAIKKNLEFTVVEESIIVPEICPLLNIPIFLGTRSNYQNSPSLDRVDNTLGYVEGNVRVISNLANTMKNCATKELLLEFCKNIPNYIMSNDIVQTSERFEDLKDKELLG
jgi:hypothetical protein